MRSKSSSFMIPAVSVAMGVKVSPPSVQSYWGKLLRSRHETHARPKPILHEESPPSIREAMPFKNPIRCGAVARPASGEYKAACDSGPAGMYSNVTGNFEMSSWHVW